MKEKIKLGRFNYTNVVPVYHDIESYLPENCCTLSEGPPSSLNSALADGVLDISPVSAFSYAVNQDKWMLVPDISISCTGEVMSVFLASDEKFENLDKKKIILTNESASAASLTRILFLEKGMNPEFHTGDIRKIKKDEFQGVLVIGDNALLGDWKLKYKNIYDLGKMWFDHTKLPFVFGLWAVLKKSYSENRSDVCEVVKSLLNNKIRNLEKIDQISGSSAIEKKVEPEFMEKYFNTIEYDLDENKIKGLNLFYDLLFKHGLILKKVNPKFMEII